MKNNSLYLFFNFAFFAIPCCQSQQASNISVKVLNERINKSQIKIEAESPTNERIILWNEGRAKQRVPNYGAEGFKWFIIYNNDTLGEFIHSKVIMNEPLQYNFTFNCNQDSTIFVQVNIPSQGTNFSGRYKQKKDKNCL